MKPATAKQTSASRRNTHGEDEDRRRSEETSIVAARLALRDRLLSHALTTYAILWVVEGAVRKWIPGTESVFYLFRDALLVGALIFAAIVAPAPVRRWMGVAFWTLCATLVTIGFIQTIALDIPFLVPLIGLRGILAPLLPIYIVIRYRPRNVWRNVAIVIMAFAPVEALLAALQASSPAKAIVNKQLGDDGASFTTAFGVVRASGSFSSPAGLTFFVTLLLSVCLPGFSGLGIKRPLLYVGLVSSVALLALSGSRGALLNAAIVAAGWLTYLLVSSHFWRSFSAVTLTAGATFVAAILSFPVVVNAFFVRIQTASDAGTVDDRLADSAFGFLTFNSSVLGNGVGTHSNAGIRLGSGMTWIEDENTRLIAELGIAGYGILIGRFLLAIGIIVIMLAVARRKSPLIFTVGALLTYNLIAGGITTQPTSQGYFALAAAIWVSAFFSAWPPQCRPSRRIPSANPMRP